MLSETDVDFVQANFVPLDEPLRRQGGRDLGDKVAAK